MDEWIKRVLDHTFLEVGISNMVQSLLVADRDLLARTHDSIHEFVLIAPLLLPPGHSWHEKSAFLAYHHVAFHQAHRSFLEALAGYYNTAHVILRSVLELVLRGALWECLAHREYRERAYVIERRARAKVYGKRRTILDWLQEIIQRAPQVEKDFERVSGAIFDKISPLFRDPELRRLVPRPKVVVEQLAEWRILTPYSADEVYAVYSELSEEVHVAPDRTDLGRRLLRERDLFKVEVIPEEINKYLRLLHRTMDVSIVVELNVLSDWVKQSRHKQELVEKLEVLSDLKLQRAYDRLSTLLEG